MLYINFELWRRRLRSTRAQHLQTLFMCIVHFLFSSSRNTSTSANEDHLVGPSGKEGEKRVRFLIAD